VASPDRTSSEDQVAASATAAEGPIDLLSESFTLWTNLAYVHYHYEPYLTIPARFGSPPANITMRCGYELTDDERAEGQRDGLIGLAILLTAIPTLMFSRKSSTSPWNSTDQTVSWSLHHGKRYPTFFKALRVCTQRERILAEAQERAAALL
jgi:hypothetical protein